MDRIATGVLVLSLIAAIAYIYKFIGCKISLSLFLFSSLILIHGAPLLIYIYITGPDTQIYEAALGGVENKEYALANLIFAISLMIWGLMCGSEISAIAASRWRRRGLPIVGSVPLNTTIRIRSIHSILFATCLAGMLLICIEQSQLTHVFEYYSSLGSDLDKSIFRSAFGGTPYYIYNVAINSIFPFLLIVFGVYCMNQVRKSYLTLLTLFFFALVLIGKFGTLTKAAPVFFLLQLLLASFLMRSNRLSVSRILQLSTSALLLFSVVVHFTYSVTNLKDILGYLYYRIFDIPNEVLLEYFTAIPNSVPHTWGMVALERFLSLSSSESLETYFAVAEVTRGSLLSTSNAMFIGDAWAQFALLGVLATSILVGSFVRAYDLYAQSLGYSDLYVCMTAGGIPIVISLLCTAFTTALITGGLLIIPVLATSFVSKHSTLQRMRINNRT